MAIINNPILSESKQYYNQIRLIKHNISGIYLSVFRSHEIKKTDKFEKPGYQNDIEWKKNDNEIFLAKIFIQKPKFIVLTCGLKLIINIMDKMRLKTTKNR